MDTDVEILVDNPFDSFLKYDNFFSFENERQIATGLCYGCCAHSDLCFKLLAAYQGRHYTGCMNDLNTRMNKPILIKEFPSISWDGNHQIFSNVLILGVAEYNKLMRHYGTKTWCQDLPHYKLSGETFLKKILRNPKIFKKIEQSKWLPLYEWFSYDLLDLGLLYFIKRNILKLYRKISGMMNHD